MNFGKCLSLYGDLCRALDFQSNVPGSTPVKLPFYSSLCKHFVFAVGCDGVGLNVLDDILGEQANDEFAAELDTAAPKSSGKIILLHSCIA